VGLQFPSKGNGYAQVCALAVAVTTRRYVSPSLATLGGVGLAYASVTSRTITPTERWLEPLALMVLIGVLWWRAVHPRAPQPYDPARQAVAPDARLAQWFTIGSAAVAIASLVAVAVFVWLALKL
jgi:hypothetical protein